MQLCKRFTPRTVLIFNGSAKLQLLFNWLLGWVNSEYLPVESCSVMKTLVMYGRGPDTSLWSTETCWGGFGTSLCRGQAGSVIVVIVVHQVYFTALAAHGALMSPLKRGFPFTCDVARPCCSQVLNQVHTGPPHRGPLQLLRSSQ